MIRQDGAARPVLHLVEPEEILAGQDHERRIARVAGMPVPSMHWPYAPAPSLIVNPRGAIGIRSFFLIISLNANENCYY